MSGYDPKGLYIFGVLEMRDIDVSFQTMEQIVLVWLQRHPEHAFSVSVGKLVDR